MIIRTNRIFIINMIIKDDSGFMSFIFIKIE